MTGSYSSGSRLIGLCLLCGLVLLLTGPAAFSQGGGNKGGLALLEEKIAALEAKVAALETRNAALEGKTQDMQRDLDPNTGQPTVRFSGVNLQVVDGSGDTAGAVNGLGNLIVGYNDLRTLPGHNNVRTGSHNLIVGDLNNYPSFGGLVAGFDNAVSNEYASVSGGNSNEARGIASSVSGGVNNIAHGYYCSVSGGGDNHADGFYSSISGGKGHGVNGIADWRAGGLFQDE